MSNKRFQYKRKNNQLIPEKKNQTFSTSAFTLLPITPIQPITKFPKANIGSDLEYPLVMARTLRYIAHNTELIGFFNPNILVQTEDQYKNATFEDAGDMMNLSIV